MFKGSVGNQYLIHSMGDLAYHACKSYQRTHSVLTWDTIWLIDSVSLQCQCSKHTTNTHIPSMMSEAFLFNYKKKKDANLICARSDPCHFVPDLIDSTTTVNGVHTTTKNLQSRKEGMKEMKTEKKSKNKDQLACLSLLFFSLAWCTGR